MAAWTEQINRHKVIRPAAIASCANGRLPAAVLAPIHDAAGAVIGQLEATAARSWDAMVLAAAAAGVHLSAVSTYRDYAHQLALWNDRYDHTDHGRGGRTCGGDFRYLKPDVATAACPGTSNHGLGLAVDVNHHGAGVVSWLAANAHLFRWEWELATEEWHIHYWPGDNIPPAVTAEEAPQMTDEQWVFLQAMNDKLDQIQATQERQEQELEAIKAQLKR